MTEIFFIYLIGGLKYDSKFTTQHELKNIFYRNFVNKILLVEQEPFYQILFM